MMTIKRFWVFIALCLAVTTSGYSEEDKDHHSQKADLAELIDVGGYALFIDCRGQGEPTVLIDGGAGTWSAHYRHIQDRLTPDVRVCTYDRAGLGMSGVGPSPRTSRQMVKELHTLLQRAGESAPMLYVGHSLGGYNARIFQENYPNQIVGIVLVDAGHEQQFESLPAEVKELTLNAPPLFRQLADMAKGGLIRQEDAERQVAQTYSMNIREELIQAFMTAKPHTGSAAEFGSALSSAAQVPPEQHLGDLPLVVLSAWNSFAIFEGTIIPVESANRAWLTLQRELASLSNNAVQVMSEGTHNLNETHPQDIVRAIQIGIALVRT